MRWQPYEMDLPALSPAWVKLAFQRRSSTSAFAVQLSKAERRLSGARSGSRPTRTKRAPVAACPSRRRDRVIAFLLLAQRGPQRNPVGTSASGQDRLFRFAPQAVIAPYSITSSANVSSVA